MFATQQAQQVVFPTLYAEADTGDTSAAQDRRFFGRNAPWIGFNRPLGQSTQIKSLGERAHQSREVIGR